MLVLNLGYWFIVARLWGIFLPSTPGMIYMGMGPIFFGEIPLSIV